LLWEGGIYSVSMRDHFKVNKDRYERCPSLVMFKSCWRTSTSRHCRFARIPCRVICF